MRRLPGYPSLKVLDLSCGQGEILSALARDGCDVRGTHYREDDYKTSGKEVFLRKGLIDTGVDLTLGLPYADGSFEVVILSEVVEHLGTYHLVISEAGRVLKPGGHLLLSTPNIHRVHSRWHFFWSGTHKLIRRRVGWDLKRDDLYAYHINPVDFPLLHTLLHQSNMKISHLAFTRFKMRHAYWLLLYPVFWLSSRLEMGRKKGDELWRKGERDLFRWMVHPAMLYSEQILLVARRN
jgi:2-polyprenyl-3-methyl-5-hydroxy-6-metoxy-1,4-benzoquinol methylase